MSFLDLCEQYFSTRDLFELLHIQRNATEKEVRKAYHKFSLLCHPDRVDENKKAEATEKFKILGKVHSILSDPEKRSIYIETGVYDWEEEDVHSFENQDWEDYWRKMFRKITLDDIKKYEQQYIGSEEELNDIKKAYNQWKGDMDKIYNCVPFLSLNEENRVRGIIQELINSKELVPYDIFVNESQAKKDRRIRKLKKEEKEAEEEMKKRKEEEESNMDVLAKAIMERRQISSESFLDALEKKYSSPGGKKRGRKLKS